MFKPNKWEVWFESQPKWTQEYIKKQAVWNDRDMWKAGLIGYAVGMVIGLLIWF